MGEFEKCAAEASTAEIRPVNMFIQFDRSGSMMYEDSGDLLPVDKWAQSVSALTAFFTDAKSDGLNVALRFFPDNNPIPGCIGSARFGGMTPAAMTCDAMSCAEPLVPLGPLLEAPGDPQETALLAAIAGATPNSPQTPEGQTYTPMYPALEGALIWASATLAAKPGEQAVVVLVTDGEPSACEQRIDRIAALARTAHDEAGIKTYAIGIEGSQEASMNAIAVAGGTERAYFSSDAQTAQQDLLAALNEIRGSVLSCTYRFPEGGNLDVNKINVQFTGPSGMPSTLARTDRAQCADGGWYYDDPANPTSIALCDNTCLEVQSTSQAKLEIVVGCQTHVR